MPAEGQKKAGGAPRGPRKSPKQPNNPEKATTGAWQTLSKLVKDTLAAARHCNPAPEEDGGPGEGVMVWFGFAAGITRAAGKKRPKFSPQPGGGTRDVRARGGVDAAVPVEEVFTLRAGLHGGELVSLKHVIDAWESSTPGVLPKAGVKTPALASVEDANQLFVDRKSVKGFLT